MRTLLLAVSFVLAGCATSREQPNQTRETTTSRSAAVASADAAGVSTTGVDPLAGDYPSIKWMVNIMEVDSRVAIDTDGALRVDTSRGKPTPSSRVLTQAQEQRFFESVRAVPNLRQVSSPVIMSRPATDARIEIGTRDKPGAASDEIGVQLHGVLSHDDVVTNAAVYFHPRPGDTTTHSTAGAVVPHGGGLVMIASIGGADRSGEFKRWSVVFIRPTILRSIDDYPFQSATSLPSHSPAQR